MVDEVKSHAQFRNPNIQEIHLEILKKMKNIYAKQKHFIRIFIVNSGRLRKLGSKKMSYVKMNKSIITIHFSLI